MTKRHPIEDEFTEEQMRLAGIYARALTGGPTDFDCEYKRIWSFAPDWLYAARLNPVGLRPFESKFNQARTMKISLFLTLWMAAVLCVAPQARAQEVRYDFTGTYGDNTPTTSLAAPGGAYTFEFLVPKSVAVLGEVDGYSVRALVLSGSYTFDGVTESIASGTYFWSLTRYGSFSTIDVNGSMGAIHLNISEPQSLVALPPFPKDQTHFLTYHSHFLTGHLGTQDVSPIDFTPTSGDPFTAQPATPTSVVGTAVPAPVPEPSCLALTAIGLISYGWVAWVRHRWACQPRYPR